MSITELNHKIIMCSLADKAQVSKLACEAKLPEYTNLKHGYHVVTLLAWLRMKVELNSQDLDIIMGQSKGLAEITGRVTELIHTSVVRVAGLEKPVVFGGNILLKPKEAILKTEVAKAVKLFCSQHPLNDYLAHICKSHYTINYLDQTKLNKLLILIDFPIPSVCALLTALGYQYIAENPYLSDGIVVGVVNPETMSLYCGYDKGKFKILSYEVFCRLAAEGMLKVPLTQLETAQLQVFTNHIA